MKLELPIKMYFMLVLVLCTVLSYTMSMSIFFSYLGLTVFTYFSLFFLYRNRYFEGPLLVLLGAVFLSYYIRPFVLYADPSRFMYPEKAVITLQDIDTSMLEVLKATIIYALGYIIITKPFDRARSYIPEAPTYFLVRHKTFIFIIMAGLILLKAFLTIVLGLGMKGEKVTSSLSFLFRLIPIDLIYGVIIIYLIKYSKYLQNWYKIGLILLTALFSLTILATGSKSFFMVLAFGYGTYLIYVDRKIELIRAFLLSSFGTIAIVISFVAATAVKVANTLGKDTSYVLQVGIDVASELEVADIFDDVTSRFVGLDGSLITDKLLYWKTDNADKLKASFSFSEVILRSISMAIPGVKAGSTLGSGVAVGRYIHDLPAEEAFAGAVGSIGAFVLMMPPGLAWVAQLLFGFAIGWYTVIMRRFQNADFQYLLTFFLSYFVLFSVMSGNFDLLISLMIIKLILTVVYYVVVEFLSMAHATFEPKLDRQSAT